MRTYKWLISVGSFLLSVAILCLILTEPKGVSASGPSCVGSVCSISDITLSDFAQGTFYLTGLRNTFEGKVQLLPIGLTSPWNPDSHALPGNRAELATVIYKDIIYAIGGFDGVHSVARPEIFSAPTLITGPLASAWTTASTLPVGLGSMPAVISTTQSGAFMYVLGGQTNSNLGDAGYTSTIFYNSINSNGAFNGSWLPTLPITNIATGKSGLVYHQAIVHNGFLYVIGGKDGFSDHAEIFHAPIDPNSGAIGSWIQDISIPNGSGLNSFGAVVWPNGSGTDYLYVLGGQNGSGIQPNVYVSAFQPSGAVSLTIGSFPVPLGGSYGLGAVQGNGELFLTGGNIGSGIGISNAVESALINPDGSLKEPGWISTNPLPEARYYHGSVINSGGEVYVIGGYSGEASATSTVYHGSTSGSGVGGQFAPSGTYTSRIINLGAQQPLTSLSATTTLTNTSSTVVTLTLQYRLASSQNALSSAPWTTLPNPLSGINRLTSYPLSGTLASFVQYRAFFTSTVSSLSPMLNEIDFNYPSPVIPSDLVISYMQAPPTSTISSTKAITIQISNIGQGAASPIRRSVVAAPSKLQSRVPLSRSPLSANAPVTTTHYFWIDVYADHLPTGVTDLSNIGCYASWNLDTNPLPPGTHNFIPFGLNCTLGQFTSLYAQVDTCPNPADVQFPNCTQSGQILESNENNNIFGPVSPGSSGGNPGGGGLIQFFPYIRRGS